MMTAEQTAYELSEWASGMIREEGRDAIGIWDIETNDTNTDIEAVNKYLAEYDDKTPDERGKGYQVRLVTVRRRCTSIRIRYTKINQ